MESSDSLLPNPASEMIRLLTSDVVFIKKTYMCSVISVEELR
jgi:hypothetical protein